MSSALLGTGGGYETFLIHSVEIRRRTGETDRLGQEIDLNPSSFGDIDPDLILPGRLDRGKGGLTNRERSADVFEVTHMLFMQKDADVNESDAVTVKDPITEEVLLPIAKVRLKNLVYVNTEPHHVELTVVVQRGPQ